MVIANTLTNNPRDDSTHGYHQTINTEIRLIIFSAAKDGEALYDQKETTTTTKTIHGADYCSDHKSLLQNSGLNFKK